MKKETKRKILIIVACILAVIGTLTAIFYPDSDINNQIGTYQNIVIDEIQAIEEENIIEDDIVVYDVTENEEESSSEDTIEKATVEEEKELEVEEIDIEIEGFELENEDNIAYDGERAKSWNVELGDYNGLTYYSQIDSRWKNVLYTSTNNSSQTIGSSGCGPTTAAVVVSSIKGTITPDTMASLFVQNGYRSANNGTYWSAYRAVADEFNIRYTETSNFNTMLEKLKDNNYVICSVGNGLFTTGGHYIVLVGIEGNTLKIYDPYMYSGKFETSTRRGKVVVEGNTIYCSVDNFLKYANYKGFFCYQNIEHNVSKYTSGRALVNIPIQIAWQGSTASYDNSLVDSNGYQFWIKNSVIINNHVYGLADIAYDGGTTDLIQVLDRQFWCNEIYMSDIPVTPIIENTVGQNRKLKQSSIIYSNSNLTGLKYNYRANTTITILDNVSSTIDKVKVTATGRTGYIKNNNYK